MAQTMTAAPAQPEDCRIVRARQVLAESKAAPDTTAEAARWWGTLETTVALLLEYIGEHADHVTLGETLMMSVNSDQANPIKEVVRGARAYQAEWGLQ